MRTKIGAFVAIIVVAVTAAVAQASPGLRAFPFANPGATAAWHANEGPDIFGRGSHAMHLEAPSDEPGRPPISDASAGVRFEGVEGITLTELGYDIRNGETCDQEFGPRLHVNTEPEGEHFVFNCGSGVRVPAPDDPANWSRVRFTDADSPCCGTWPGFGNAVVRSIHIEFLIGETHLDNFDISGVLIGGPGSYS